MMLSRYLLDFEINLQLAGNTFALKNPSVLFPCLYQTDLTTAEATMSIQSQQKL